MLRWNDPYPSRKTNPSPVRNEVVKKLVHLIEDLESESKIRRRSRRNRTQELIQLRAELADVATQLARPFCNCRTITVADSGVWRDFETDINTPCPIHGQRRFRIIVTLMGYPSDRDPDDHRLAELLLEHRRRQAPKTGRSHV